MSINHVALSGRLTRDPDLRCTADGLLVLDFAIAVNDRRKDQATNEWENRPNFVDCTVLGPRAEALSRYLSKGVKVAVEGKLRWNAWERDGRKRSKITVTVRELEFLSKTPAGGGIGREAPEEDPFDASADLYC